MNEFVPSPEFADLFFLAIDHGFSSIEDGSGPLVPFTMTLNTTGEKGVTRFAAELLEEGLEQARASISAGSSLTMYAIAWDGYITLEGRKWDAVFVEAGETQAEYGALFCQRYLPVRGGLFRKARNKRVGNPAMVERIRSRLWAGHA